MLRLSLFDRRWVSEEANARKNPAPEAGGLLSALFRGIVRKIRRGGTGIVVKSRSLSWRLGLSTLAAVLPLAAFALIMVGWIAHNEREAERRMLVGDAYSLAKAVGREINADFLLSAALSHSGPLQHGDLPGFAEQARGMLAEAPGASLIVSTRRRRSCVERYLRRRRIRRCFATGRPGQSGDSNGLLLSLRCRRQSQFARAERFDRNSGLHRWQAGL